MCSKKSDENYYRCDKADCSDRRRKRRANREAFDAALSDEDMQFLQNTGIDQDSLLDPDEDSDKELDDRSSHYEEASERVDNFLARYRSGEIISYEEITAAEQDIRYIGSVLSHEAEDRAGVTIEEIESEWGQRYDEMMVEYAEITERVTASEEKLSASQELLASFEDDDPAYSSLYYGSHVPILEEHNALVAEQNEKYQEVLSTFQWTDEETQERVFELAEGYRAVLAEERSLGGSVEASGSNGPGFYAISRQTQYLPSEWVKTCNESPYELHIEDIEEKSGNTGLYDGRSSYTEKAEFPGVDGRMYVGSIIRIPENEMGTVMGERKAIHEYMHHVQSNYSDRVIEKLEATHINNRRQVIKGQREELQVLARGANAKEYGYVDHFVDPYMGTVKHSQKHFEVMTTGVEALFTGSYYGLTRKDSTVDYDMRNFVLGVMAKI